MIKKLSRPILAIAAACAFVLAHAGAAEQAKVPDAAAAAAATAAAKPAPPRRLSLTGTPSLAKIEKSGSLRVGIALNAPFVMHDKQGQPIGYSVDLAHRFADAMGWKLQLVENSWPNLMSGLRANEYDLVISGLSITPQRARNVLFSDAVGSFNIEVVANRDKFPKGGLAELRALANAKVGARKGVLTLDYARDALGSDAVVAVDSESAALADLLDGKLVAYVAESPLPEVMAQAHADKLRVLDGAPLARTAHGVAARLDDASLMRVVNAWIVFEQASGWLKQRDDYWFKGTAWAGEL
ncbi:MAG: amino acid ABC transporter substrate-binding protein [Proteobacteria bacterium]|nr:amino acid ABC transporter substrate-binding protein [Pseudomonadota bacterium]